MFVPETAQGPMFFQAVNATPDFQESLFRLSFHPSITVLAALSLAPRIPLACMSQLAVLAIPDSLAPSPQQLSVLFTQGRVHPSPMQTKLPF